MKDYHELKWQHTITLPTGETLKGEWNYDGEAGKRFLVPEDLTDKSVIDFGTWDGYWAIEAKRRGATRVVASDRWDPMLPTAEFALGQWEIPYWYSADLDFPLSEQFQPEFDLVLFFGIIYHQKNPYMGFWNAAKCCKPGGIVIVESAIEQGKCANLPKDFAAMWVIDSVHADDPTNYHMPNEAAVIQLAKMAGLEWTGQSAFHRDHYPRMTAVFKKSI